MKLSPKKSAHIKSVVWTSRKKTFLNVKIVSDEAAFYYMWKLIDPLLQANAVYLHLKQSLKIVSQYGPCSSTVEGLETSLISSLTLIMFSLLSQFVKCHLFPRKMETKKCTIISTVCSNGFPHIFSFCVDNRASSLFVMFQEIFIILYFQFFQKAMRPENTVAFCSRVRERIALSQWIVVTLFFPLVVHNNQSLDTLHKTSAIFFPSFTKKVVAPFQEII